MTKDEIKSLVAAKIAGQGTNVDAASVLPSIIEGILDLIPEGGTNVVRVLSIIGASNETDLDVVLDAWGITEEQSHSLFENDSAILMDGEFRLQRTCLQANENSPWALFGGTADRGGYAFSIGIDYTNRTTECQWYEV